MGSQSKIQHAQYLQYGNNRFAVLNFASSLQRGKRIQMRKGAATIARRNAFLEMNTATAKHREWARINPIRLAQGGPPLPEPDVELYLERYRLAVEEQKRVKGGN